MCVSYTVESNKMHHPLVIEIQYFRSITIIQSPP
jgi:hypothetical protein